MPGSFVEFNAVVGLPLRSATSFNNPHSKVNTFVLNAVEPLLAQNASCLVTF